MFENSKRSVLRARVHISDLESAIAKFNSSGDSYRIVKQAFGDRSKFVVKAKLTKELPEELESIVTDAIYNLRASLDQAIYTAAKIAKANTINGGIDLSKKHWEFPIKHKIEHVNTSLDYICRPKGIPDEIRGLVLKRKPYYSESGESIIWALKNLANINKHKYIVPSSIRSSYIKLKHVSGPKINGKLEHIEFGGGGNVIKTVPDDAPVGSDEIGLYVSAYAPKSVYEVTTNVDIKFRDTKGLESRTCLYHLAKMAEICDDIIIDFEDLYERLGYR